MRTDRLEFQVLRRVGDLANEFEVTVTVPKGIGELFLVGDEPSNPGLVEK